MAKTIVYPEMFNEIANIIGFMRWKQNESTREQDTQYDRGALGHEVDRLGVLAELIGQYLCFSNEKEYTATQLLAKEPLKEPDIVMGRMWIDVKGVADTCNELRVNLKAHHKAAKEITHYLFIQKIGKNVARYWWSQHDHVSQWPVKKGFTDYYYLEIPK